MRILLSLTRVAIISLFAALTFAGCDSSDASDGNSDTAAAADVPTSAPTDVVGADGATAGDTAGDKTIPPHMEERDDFTVVWLSGTPYEMGFQHGEMLRDTITEAVVFVENDFTLSMLPDLAEGMGILDVARATSYPQILDECQGLVDGAEGSGFTMELCLALNFGDVMLEYIYDGMPPERGASERGPGCSGLIATGAATGDGRLLQARNLDWGSMDISIIHQNPVIFVRQPTGELAHVYVGFPMNLSPYTGMNEAGISIGSQEADPAGPEEQSREGRSHVQMVARLLATAESLDDVRAFVAGEKHMSSELLVVGDGPNAEGAIFEMTASGVGVRELTDGVVFGTNHFVHEDMVARHAPPAEGSLRRLQRFEQLVRPDGADTRWGTFDPASMAATMRDRVHPESGEEPTDEELEALNWDNDVALGANGPMHFVVFDPDKRLFWVAAGAPPIHRLPYRCFSLDALLGRPSGAPCEPSEL